MNQKETVLGIELGSTRIKVVLLDKAHLIIAEGSHTWENQLVDGIWTYSLEQIHQGIQSCYADLKRNVFEKYGTVLTEVGAIGVSAMMHGYLPFDKHGHLLTNFRTWRNTMTREASAELTELFQFHIPQRWSIAHLYKAIKDKEPHVQQIAFLTTLSGYIHWMLTGNRVIGIGDASGMFPIDPATMTYDNTMLEQFRSLCSRMDISWDIEDILPEVLVAGKSAGVLTPVGAKFLDPSGDLIPGIPLAPCEGDAGTGMVATNSLRASTGNVSAGTSVFAMVVLDRPIGVHREIDLVTTPTGKPVAMVHCNNCTSDLNAWINLFSEFLTCVGYHQERDELFQRLFQLALEGDPDCGGLMSYNYFSGESITNFTEGRPLFVRQESCKFNLANFMRTHLFSALATLKIGLELLTQTEGVQIVRLYGHGGYFKTPEVGQRILSAATETPVSVMDTASEGGAYGMALLCAYMLWHEDGQTLADYLEHNVFRHTASSQILASSEEITSLILCSDIRRHWHLNNLLRRCYNVRRFEAAGFGCQSTIAGIQPCNLHLGKCLWNSSVQWPCGHQALRHSICRNVPG